MEINVKVITNSKQNKIIKVDDLFKVYLTSLPVKGRANKELIRLLAQYFSVKKTNIKIIRGEKNKNKLVKIDNLYNKRTDNVLKICNISHNNKKKDYISKVHCWER